MCVKSDPLHVSGWDLVGGDGFPSVCGCERISERWKNTKLKKSAKGK